VLRVNGVHLEGARKYCRFGSLSRSMDSVRKKTILLRVNSPMFSDCRLSQKVDPQSGSLGNVPLHLVQVPVSHTILRRN
jgi:hypothetical protein